LERKIPLLGGKGDPPKGCGASHLDILYERFPAPEILVLKTPLFDELLLVGEQFRL
jgi:hypothetical protein